MQLTNAFNNEKTYLRMLDDLMCGSLEDDRTGVNTISTFGYNCEYAINNGLLPLLSTKKVNFNSILHELLWMLSGSSRLKYLIDNNVHIWDEWVIPGTEVWGEMLTHGDRIRIVEKRGLLDEFTAFRAALQNQDDLTSIGMWLYSKNIPTHKLIDGDLGPVYGAQWRKWEDLRYIRSNLHPKEYHESMWDDLNKRGYTYQGIDSSGATLMNRSIDQIAQIEDALRNNKNSRRIILSGWNVARIDEMALPPCHTLAQWKVHKGNVLDCILFMRSNDAFLGNPFNIVFYSLLTQMLAKAHGLQAECFKLFIGDAHIYRNHISQVELQLSRNILEDNCPVAIISDRKVDSILEYTADDIQLEGYEHQSYIAAPVAV